LEKRKALSPGARALLAEIRGGWDKVGKRIFVKDKPGIQGFAYDDRCVLTLRKLNVLLREKYLPKDFPYTTPYTEGKARVRYRDALFTVRTGALTDDSARVVIHGFGVEIAANAIRLTTQLGIPQVTGRELRAPLFLKQLIQPPVEDERGRFHAGTRGVVAGKCGL